MGRLLATDRQRGGADGVEPVNTRGQYGGHSSALPVGVGVS
jgi:hypothetical protein